MTSPDAEKARVVWLVRDGAVQTVAAFSTREKAETYIKSKGQEQFWDIERVVVNEVERP